MVGVLWEVERFLRRSVGFWPRCASALPEWVLKAFASCLPSEFVNYFAACGRNDLLLTSGSEPMSGLRL